jgi:hypothetical protein
MAKRFTDSELWKKQRWFRKLSANHKLAFMYIKDQCDHAGIWKIDCADLVDDLGLPTFNLTEFVESCNTDFDKVTGQKKFKERIRVLDRGSLWVTGFFQFQYAGKGGSVNASAAPVKTAIQILQGLGLFDEGLAKGYITLKQELQETYTSPKEKDKDKEKDKEEFKYEFVEKKETQEFVPRESKSLSKVDLFEAIFTDEMYLEGLAMVHRNKDIKLAFEECYIHHSNAPNPPSELGEWKQKLNTWLINTKNGNSKTSQRTDSVNARREAFAKRHGASSGSQ